MTATPLLRPKITVGIAASSYSPRDVEIELDEGAVPFGEATVELPLLSDAAVAFLNPQAGDRRVPVSAADGTDTPRVFDMGLRSRKVDHVAKTVTLKLATDEAIVQDYRLLADDQTCLGLAGSLRSVVNYVLGRAVTVRQNLIPNPSFTVDASSWTNSTGAGTIARVTTVAGAASGCGQWTASATGTSQVRTTTLPAVAGQVLSALGSLRAEQAGSYSGLLLMSFFDAASVQVGSTVSGSAVAVSSSAWTAARMDGVMVPAGAVSVRVFARISNAASITDKFDVDTVLLEPAAVAGAYFSGDSTAGSGVAYKWVGTASSSVSLQLAALLSPPAGDADVTPAWTATNLITNPSFEASATTGYLATTNVSGYIISTTAGFLGPTGTKSLRYTATAAGNSRIDVGPTLSTYKVTPGRTYWFSFWHRSSTARSGTIGMRFYNADGDPISTVTGSFTSSSTAMGQFSVSAQAPAGAASVWPYIITLSNSSGQFHYLDCVQLTEGQFLADYLDGDRTATSVYSYAWAGTASASQSIRTLLIDRPAPDSLVWAAGQSGWEFLMALCATAGMVLWCDESRQWRLATPADRTVPGLVSIAPLNTRDGADTLSRDDESNFATGVLLRYSWTDADGIGRERVDSAGSPGKPIVRNLDQPYPGPGVAAAMLARLQGTGRAQAVTSITRWATTPGMTANISLPGAPDTSGRVASVVFHSDGFMDVGTTGLVDIIPGSVAALLGTVAALSGTVASL